MSAEDKIRTLIAQYEEAQQRDHIESEARLAARAALIADLKRLLEESPNAAPSA
jgi:hypothetical protein